MLEKVTSTKCKNLCFYVFVLVCFICMFYYSVFSFTYSSFIVLWASLPEINVSMDVWIDGWQLILIISKVWGRPTCILYYNWGRYQFWKVFICEIIIIIIKDLWSLIRWHWEGWLLRLLHIQLFFVIQWQQKEKNSNKQVNFYGPCYITMPSVLNAIFSIRLSQSFLSN